MTTGADAMPRSKATVNFHTTTLSADADALGAGACDCPACGSALDVQQPDPDDPSRLLWVCVECRSWFLLYQDPRGRSVVVTLPAPAARARHLARA
jgi:hypothetical protein